MPFALVVGVVGFSFGVLVLPRLGSYRPDSFLGRHLLRHGPVRGGGGPWRRRRGAHRDRRRRAPERTLWVSIVAVTLASAAIKAAGPLLAGGRELPPSANAVLPLLKPALVVTGTFGEGGHLTIDEKALGVGVAAVALTLRAPVLLAVFLAALVTALARLFLG